MFAGRRPHTGMITTMSTTTTTVTMTTTTTITTAMRIIAMATTRASTPSRMCTDRIAGTITSMTTTTRMDMVTKSTDLRELPLLLWLSPAFPVGAFAYSHGLEWAVEAGDIFDAESLAAWLDDLRAFGAPRVDAMLFVAAHRAVGARDWRGLTEANELAIALAGSQERRLETSAQGLAFVVAARAAWDCEALAYLPAAGGDPVAYPIAVGVASAGHGFALESALPAFIVALFANLVSAAVRLSAIGQTDGQRVLAALLPRLSAMACECAIADFDTLGGCAFRSDLAALKHETQYSRLFRS
jgi:urease accessory protein